MDEDLTVLKNYVQWNIFGPHCGAAGKIRLNLNKIIRPQAVADVLELTVHLNMICTHEFSEVHSAKAVKLFKKVLIKSCPIKFGFDLEMQCPQHIQSGDEKCVLGNS